MVCTQLRQGKTITIRNVSGRPLILSYWELQYGRGWWPFRRFETFQWPEPDDVTDCTIDAYSSHMLAFANAEHFEWGVATLRGRSLHIRLHFAGRRPTTLLVYRSSK